MTASQTDTFRVFTDLKEKHGNEQRLLCHCCSRLVEFTRLWLVCLHFVGQY